MQYVILHTQAAVHDYHSASQPCYCNTRIVTATLDTVTHYKNEYQNPSHNAMGSKSLQPNVDPAC
jgi:hypothetical protein